MASSLIDPRYLIAPDGARLAWREVEPPAPTGRPVVLLHGFFSDAMTNWVKYGHAEWIAATGRRVIMPDLRAHGDSDRSHDPAAYPADVLASDGAALIAHLGLAEYDLGGYSLGARTAVRMVVAGATPRRLVVGGMGLRGIIDVATRAAHFRRILTNLGSFERGTPEWFAEAFLRTTRGDAAALRLLLDSFRDTPIDELAAIAQTTLVVSGGEDHDNGSAQELADALPAGHYVEVPGNHMSAVTKRDFGEALASFFAGADAPER